jgi:Phage integrase, N-terminal SAM-like domain
VSVTTVQVRVQRVVMPSGAESATVLLGDGSVVEPVERFLAHLTAVERSPNTVKAYAHDLRDYFEFLECLGLQWDRVVLDLGRFVAWLRLPGEARDGRVAMLPWVDSDLCAATVNRKLSVTWNLAAAGTISLRYDHGLRRCVGQGSADGEVASARPARAGRRLAAGVGRSWSCAQDDGRLRARAGRIP